MRVALTGASGHLGAAILQELSKRDIQVNALYRDDDTRSCAGLPVNIIKGDIMHTEALKTLMKDCDAVIHCAALISVNGGRNGQVQQVNVTGTQLVIDNALRSGIKRLIHISSIHAFQQQPSRELLNENREPVTEKAYAYDRSKLAGQKIALAANEHGMEVLVIHPTSVIGPYDHKPSLMGQVIIDLYKGKLPFVFNGGFDFCDCRDVANATINALFAGKPGESYLLCGKWYSLSTLSGFLSAASSRKIRPVALPPVAAWMGLPVVKLIAAISRKEPLYTKEALDAIFTGNRCISSQKAKLALNYSARPFEETINDTFNWFKNNGYLD